VIVYSFSVVKDDICDANTVTTSRLVISFYDVTNSAILKCNESKITGEEWRMELFLMVVVWLTGTVSIPLKTNADATTFSFILNSGSTNPALVNEDILKFNYAREELLYLERVVLKQNILSILELRMSLLMLQ
jgi:hypothetical protein